MIELSKDQALKNEPEYRVAVAGSYEPNDLVPVYHEDQQEVAVCAYPAYYVLHGTLPTEP